MLFSKIHNKFKELYKRFEELDKLANGKYTVDICSKTLKIKPCLAKFILEIATRSGDIDFQYDVKCLHCNQSVATYRYRYEIPKNLKQDNFLCKNNCSIDAFYIEKIYVLKN